MDIIAADLNASQITTNWNIKAREERGDQWEDTIQSGYVRISRSKSTSGRYGKHFCGWSQDDQSDNDA